MYLGRVTVAGPLLHSRLAFLRKKQEAKRELNYRLQES